LKAYCLIRPQPHYRREAFQTGLRMAGLDVRNGPPANVGRDTVVLMWNRYGDNHLLASRVEAAGGTVLVAENGYINRGGGTPKFDLHEGVEPGHYYALAIGGHNGSGQWPQGGEDRLAALDLQLKPWREGGDYILVCPSRNFGQPDMLMPSGWLQQTIARLRKVNRLPIRVREHPGNSRPPRGLDEELQGAAAVVIWASSAGVHALAQGVPVAAYAPHWIAKLAAFDDVTEMMTLYGRPDVMEKLENYRRAAFERLAWAQWTVDEIAGGEPFDHLLRHARQSESVAAL